MISESNFKPLTFCWKKVCVVRMGLCLTDLKRERVWEWLWVWFGSKWLELRNELRNEVWMWGWFWGRVSHFLDALTRDDFLKMQLSPEIPKIHARRKSIANSPPCRVAQNSIIYKIHIFNIKETKLHNTSPIGTSPISDFISNNKMYRTLPYGTCN